MTPLPHPNCTHRFGAPRDWNEAESGPCGTLEVSQITGASGPFSTALESLWRPDSAELDALNAGGAVILTIQGSSHPVVSLGVTVPDQLGVG